jgi:hypothetical protein
MAVEGKEGIKHVSFGLKDWEHQKELLKLKIWKQEIFGLSKDSLDTEMSQQKGEASRVTGV